ncbi:MAG: hypothetical protein PHZ07_04280 [Patescibacteria group bacterium]|nr:hypothetical protein [Patescibacteria group bacterium]MDD4304739.1 hypothetical protein [Patescibacteria group bacterium]MDD4695506.1 hypothetical protein [Patescibacteria group bacterium]
MSKVNKFLYWTPRILSIIFILFLMMFSLDVFDGQSNFWQILIGFFIHNIPALFLIGVLTISWKYEIVGGIVFILAGLFYIVMLLKGGIESYQIFWILSISGPAFLIGILFMINWKKRKNIIKN